MKTYDKLYIGGEWTPSSGKGSFDVVNASTEEVMGRIPAGNAADVDRAARAARAAFDPWSRTTPAERAGHLLKIQASIVARTKEIAETIAAEVGMPIGLSTAIQAGLPTVTFGSAAQIATSYPFEEQTGNSLVVREPVGVVGCITPWNYPLHIVAAKVAPAIAAGRSARSSSPRSSTPSVCRAASSISSAGTGKPWARPSPATPTSTW